jgi:asparagine synthetase B (glutamine-hydrolysing)
VAIALSGGVDSCSVLAACLREDIQPTVISYTPDTHPSTDWEYANNNARMHALPFRTAMVDMSPESLYEMARKVIMMGYKTKMQVESLVPMLAIAHAARVADVEVLLTGDQADGYYINGNWISRNYDRAQGVPGPLRKHVKEDKDTERIDALRHLYWTEDRANTAAVAAICAEEGVRAVMPYRSTKLYRVFLGTHWREVNEPRLKEPAWQAFPEMHTGGRSGGIWVRKAPVNLHRGDSRFAETMGRELMALKPGPWKTPTGLYAAIAKGEA